MSATELVDTRFLNATQELIFRSRVPKLREWYDTALDAFIHKSELPYAPKVYVVPFFHQVKHRVNVYQSVIHREIATTGLDAELPKERWAIYLPSSVVKNAPREINIASLAHELVHIWMRSKGTEAITAAETADAIKQGKTLFDIYKMKEREVKNAEDMFQEPVRSFIVTMNTEQEKEFAKPTGLVMRYLAGTNGVTTDQLNEKVYGDSKVVQEILDTKFKELQDHFRRLGLL